MKNNKFFRAVTVSAVIALLIITYIPLFSVTSFAVCAHGSTSFVGECNGDGSHTYIERCSSCEEVVGMGSQEGCFDDDHDQSCDVCGGIVPCDHSSTYLSYSPEPYGQHWVDEVCNYCSESVGNGYTEGCVNYDGDSVCDHCGQTLEELCEHVSTEDVYESLGNRTHLHKVICTACEEVVSSDSSSWNCYDYNSDNKCDLCKGSMTVDVVNCQHPVKRPVASSLGDEKHYVGNVCMTCGQTVSSVGTFPCVDNDGDGKCDDCGAAKTCKHSWKDGKCTLCNKVCPHEYSFCYPSKKYKDAALIELSEKVHEEYIKCGVCGYDKVSTVRELHVWEDGKCSDCGYVCEHEYFENKCIICKLVKIEISYDVNYGTWGDLFFSKDAKYEKTSDGYYFVRCNEYIGGVNLLNLHEGVFEKKSDMVSMGSIGQNLCTIYDNVGAPNNRLQYFSFSLSSVYERMENGAEYTLSYEKTSPCSSSSIYMWIVDENGNGKSYYPKSASGKFFMTFTYNEKYSYNLIFHTNTSSSSGLGSSFKVTFSNIQIEKGTEATTFVPFGALYIPEYDDVFDKAYKDAVAALDGKEGAGGIVKGLIDSVWGITQDCFERLDKATTINGISVGGIVSTVVVFVIVFFVLKLVNK